MRNKKGFTLMELLIVIAIIAILAAALIVGINPARQFRQARDSTRWRHLDAIATAVYSYAIEHGGGFPRKPAEGLEEADDFICIGEAGTPVEIKIVRDADGALTEGTWCLDLVVPEYLREPPPDPLEGHNYKIEFVGDKEAIMIWSTASETWHPYPEGHLNEGEPNEDDPRVYLIK